MLRYSLLSLFPALLEPWRHEALLGKALAKELIRMDIWDLRSFAGNKHNRVDDSPYGGGAGMVIRVDVVARALKALQQAHPQEPPDDIILLSPAGEPFNQALAEKLASKRHICLLAGRYEGFDARVEQLVSREISIGDYVLMGGELAALTVVEATARLLPGVLGDVQSHQQDSFSSGLLDYPEYTRPAEYAGQGIPEVLTSGHHSNIARWRRQQALLRTYQRRPELLERLQLSDDDHAFLAAICQAD